MARTTEKNDPRVNAPLPRVTEPALADSPLAGEVVPEGESEQSYLARAVAAAKSVAKSVVGSSGPKLMLNGLHAVVLVDESKFDSPHQRHQFAPLNLNLARALKREAISKLQNAERAADVARERVAALRKLAYQDNCGPAFDLIDTERPAGPTRPELTRVKVLRPFTRVYQREQDCSPELVSWLAANDGRPLNEIFPERMFGGIGFNHIVDIPAVLVPELVREGLVEIAPAGAQLQAPNGRIVG